MFTFSPMAQRANGLRDVDAKSGRPGSTMRGHKLAASRFRLLPVSQHGLRCLSRERHQRAAAEHLLAPQVATHGVQVVVEPGAYSSRAFRISSMIVSVMAFFSLEHFLGRADNGRLIARGPTDGLDLRPQGRIGDVRAVPCEQIVHSVHRSHRNMEGVSLRLCRQWDPDDQVRRKVLNLFCDFQPSQPSENLPTALSGTAVAGARFFRLRSAR